jgi:hypothetical protein
VVNFSSVVAEIDKGIHVSGGIAYHIPVFLENFGRKWQVW